MNKQSQAISILRTWLDKCEIPYRATNETLTIEGSDGGLIPAVFDPHRVMSTDMDVALDEFHSITKLAGYGEPKPVDRGTAPVQKRLFKDPLLARWRHSEMRTVPNQDDLREFMPIARREANTFYGRNKYICSSMGYDLDVAQNDALIWTNTFLGRYRIRNTDPQKEINENKKLLTNYLRQRFVEVYKGLVRENRNVHPGEAWFQHVAPVGEEPSPEWKKEHDEIGFKSPQLRRTKVKELLRDNFDRLGHDGMIQALNTVQSTHPCIDTRHAATRYLKEHAASCESCRNLKVEEEIA